VLYCVDITAPANTPQSSPVTQDVTIKAGVIRKIIVLIPYGHKALAHLVIKDGATQVFPREGDIHGDGETLTIDTWIEIPEPERTLTLVAWNEDTKYSHTFYVRIIVLPVWLAAPEVWLLDKFKAFARKLRLPV